MKILLSLSAIVAIFQFTACTNSSIQTDEWKGKADALQLTVDSLKAEMAKMNGNKYSLEPLTYNDIIPSSLEGNPRKFSACISGDDLKTIFQNFGGEEMISFTIAFDKNNLSNLLVAKNGVDPKNVVCDFTNRCGGVPSSGADINPACCPPGKRCDLDSSLKVIQWMPSN